MVMWIVALGLLSYEVARAEGETYNIIQTPSKQWTCALPVARTDGTALEDGELASVEYYVAPSPTATVNPFVVQPVDPANPACGQVIDFLNLPLGQNYLFARVTDTGGRQSENSAPVPFVLIQELAPPNAPTDGKFVDGAAP
jgi:hypothetical protein